VVSDTQLAIEILNVSKHFGGVPALTDIDVEVRHGTVHALVGQNGAGKSTLGKIISGSILPDSGQMRIFGDVRDVRTPRDAIAHGIVTIQQEIALVKSRTVIENVFLGNEPTSFGFVRNTELKERFEKLVDQTGFRLDPGAVVSSLRIADQQKVEILRALARDAEILVLDEPTASLTSNEAVLLLDVVRELRERGVTIVYVSHFLSEVLTLADTITVLRNGRVVHTVPASTQTPATLIRAMLGRDLQQTIPTRERPAKRGIAHGHSPVLAVKNLTREAVLFDVSFEVHPGEIIGIGGLVGSGRSELLRAIYGADDIDSGSVQVDGAELMPTHPHRSVAKGIAFVPESRKDDGLFLSESVAFNSVIAHLDDVSQAGFIRKGSELGVVKGLIKKLGIAPGNPSVKVSTMSGGNQQKVMLSKWLVKEPRVLLIDEPTRGVDVGAKFSIYEEIFALADSGIAIVLVSSEIEEVLGLADRVLVMHRGRIALDVPQSEADESTVMTAAFGAGRSER
jgi:rhamnose transport system ATP-binding protein